MAEKVKVIVVVEVGQFKVEYESPEYAVLNNMAPSDFVAGIMSLVGNISDGDRVVSEGDMKGGYSYEADGVHVHQPEIPGLNDQDHLGMAEENTPERIPTRPRAKDKRLEHFMEAEMNEQGKS